MQNDDTTQDAGRQVAKTLVRTLFGGGGIITRAAIEDGLALAYEAGRASVLGDLSEPELPPTPRCVCCGASGATQVAALDGAFHAYLCADCEQKRVAGEEYRCHG